MPHASILGIAFILVENTALAVCQGHVSRSTADSIGYLSSYYCSVISIGIAILGSPQHSIQGSNQTEKHTE